MRSTRGRFGLLVLVLAGYAAGSQLAFSWFGADGPSASFFPAAGVALATLVLVDERQWPIVLGAAALAELTIDLLHDISFVASLGYTLANVTQVWVGAVLVHRAGRPALDRRHGLAAFVGLGVVAAPVVGALALAAEITEREQQAVTLGYRDELFATAAAQAGAHALERVRSVERTTFLSRYLGALDRQTTARGRCVLAARMLAERYARSVEISLLDPDDQSVVVATAGATRPDDLVETDPADDAPASGSRAMVDTRTLVARGRRIGSWTIAWHPGVQADVRFVDEIAQRTAIAVDNALLYERERDASHVLQQGLLGGPLTRLRGVTIVHDYRPAAATLQVGGDSYDAFTLADDRVGLVVGDVVGHGLEAATAMAQLRAAVRALALTHAPAALLERLDDFVGGLPAAQMATVVYVELDPSTGIGAMPPQAIRRRRSSCLVCVCAGAPVSDVSRPMTTPSS